MIVNNNTRIKFYTITFIYILFISMSIYPPGPGVLKPPDLLLFFLVLVALSQLDYIKNILLIGMLLVTYLFIVDIVNNGVKVSTLYTGGKTWIYAVLFIVFAKIYASINFYKYQKSIIHAIYLSIAIIIIIYISLYFRIPFSMRYFTNVSEHLNSQYWAGGRVSGIYITVLMSFLLISYINHIKYKLNYILLTSELSLYLIVQSRTQLFTFLVLYVVLFFSKKALVFLTILGFVSFSFILGMLEILMQGEHRIVAGRIADMIYFWNSPSMHVRMNDTKYFIENWLSDLNSFFIGNGLSFTLTFPRVNFEYEPLLGKLITLRGEYRMVTFHRADNLMTELIVDGGLLLLLFISYIFIYAFIKTYQNDNRLGIAFLLMTVMNAFSTVHLVTNFTLVFFMAYLYYGSISLKNRKENNL